MKKRIITIGRQYGSNGRSIAQKLSDKLGIHYYDKELIYLASQKNDISYEELLKVDEKESGSLALSGGRRYADEPPFPL